MTIEISDDTKVYDRTPPPKNEGGPSCFIQDDNGDIVPISCEEYTRRVIAASARPTIEGTKL